ncbi:hypothetical protein G9A89_000505, partial [Geosiphon pyriformis]
MDKKSEVITWFFESLPTWNFPFHFRDDLQDFILTKFPTTADFFNEMILSIKQHELNAQEITILGCLYQEGIGFVTDIQKAIKLFQRAGRLGESWAYYFLGHLYASPNRYSNIYNRAEAICCYEQAAYMGNPHCQCSAGMMLQCGATKHIPKARYWLNKSAKSGNTIAMNGLGISYATQPRSSKDPHAAIYWYAKARRLDNEIAKHNL